MEKLMIRNAIIFVLAVMIGSVPALLAGDLTSTEVQSIEGIQQVKSETVADPANFSVTGEKPQSSTQGIDETDEYFGILLWQTNDPVGMCNDCDISLEGYYQALGISLNNQRAECFTAVSSTPIWQYSVGDVGTKVAISENAQYYVFGYGQYVSLFNGVDGTLLWTYDCGANNWVYQVAISRDMSTIAVACAADTDGRVIAFSPASSTPVWETNMTITSGFPFYGLRFSADGTHISANEKFYAWILNSSDGSTIWESSVNNTESPIPMSADGSIIAIGLNAGGICYVYSWNGTTETYDLLWSYTFTGGYSRWCNEVEVSADGSTVGAGSLIFETGGTYDGTAAVFDINGGGVPLWVSDSFGDLVGEIAISDDGSVIAIGSWGPEDNSVSDLRIYDRNIPIPFFELNHPGSINSVAMTPNGGMVFAGGKHVHNREFGNGGDAYLIRVESQAPQVELTMTPMNPPIQIPAVGGSFDYLAEIFNTEDDPVVLDAWIKAIIPTGYEQLVLGPITLSLPGGSSISRMRTQVVPGNAPPGNYTYWGYLGQYPDIVWDDMYFTFEKLETGNGPVFEEWYNIGEPFETTESVNLQNDSYQLVKAYPNPFNPTTAISYQLSAFSHVNLSVYDVSGREVASLVDGYRNAGVHEVTFDGSGLSSGVYLYQLEVSGSEATPTMEAIVGKMVLMK